MLDNIPFFYLIYAFTILSHDNELILRQTLLDINELVQIILTCHL